MTEGNLNPKAAQPAKTPHVVVAYENSSVREHAMQFCDHFARQQHQRAQPEAQWWSFANLDQPAAADKAAERAAIADVIILATTCGGELPHAVKIWIETWLTRRGEREGALVGLLDQDPGPCEVASFKEIYLRHIARRAGMDYLSHVPPTKPRAMPDSIESYNQRAGQMTSVLDKILHTQPRPTPLP